MKKTLISLLLAVAFLNANAFTIAITSGSFTRPANVTAYASGQLVANSTTAGSVVPVAIAAGRGPNAPALLRRVRLLTSSTSVTNASFRVHFYRDSPTVTNGDGGVWLSTTSTYIGACDVTVDKAFSDGAGGVGTPNNGTGMYFSVSAGTNNIYALIEARGAYTPTSGETFTVVAETEQP